MKGSARKAGSKATPASFAPPTPATERDIVWRSGTGRVLRCGDLVKVDGLRGTYWIATRQPFPDEAIAVVELPPGTKHPLASPRFVRADRIHVRRAKTKAVT